MTLRVDQSTASLLGPKESPPAPPAPNGLSGVAAPGAPPASTAPAPAYDHEWVRKCIVLVCNMLAEEWGPGMKATELELAVAVPVVHAMALERAPAFMAGQAPDANLWVLGAVVLYMGARRGLAYRRWQREKQERELAGKPARTRTAHNAGAPAGAEHAPPAPVGAAAPAPSPPGDDGPRGAFGPRPVVLGGMLGDGRRT